jgi:hypothetical protein
MTFYQFYFFTSTIVLMIVAKNQRRLKARRTKEIWVRGVSMLVGLMREIGLGPFFCFVQGCPPKMVVLIAIDLKLYFY